MKKLFFLISTILITLALTFPVSATEYNQDIFSVFAYNESDPTLNVYPDFGSSPQTPPSGAVNYINIVPYLSNTYDNYIYGYYPSKIIGAQTIQNQPTLTIVFEPLASSDTSNVITSEDYLNHLEMRAAIAIPSNMDFQEYTNHIGLYWMRSDSVGQGDLMAMYAMNATRLITIDSQHQVQFQGVDTGGASYTRNLTIYVVRLDFILNETISIDDARSKVFQLRMPLINPWFQYAATISDTEFYYQFACNDLKLDVVTLDNLVAQIGSQLGDVNNNLVILQNLNQDIINALLESEYAEEVQEYIDSVKAEQSKADNAANIEASLWNMFEDYEYSFDADESLSLMTHSDFLWKDWVIAVVILAISLALTSRILYG